jgi:hypothetical protein
MTRNFFLSLLIHLFLSTLTVMPVNATSKWLDSVPSKVLVLGNSITYHGAKPSVGWIGNWGMAASSAEKDYVHILQTKIKKTRPGILFKFGNIADTFERKFWEYNTHDFKNYNAFDADLVILVIGENINNELAVKYGLGAYLEQFVKMLSTQRNLKVCLVGSFWPNKDIDRIMKATAEKNNWLYVDLQGLYQERDKNTAINQYEDKGVGMHPSDQGMQGIAQRIWNTIQNLFISQL